MNELVDNEKRFSDDVKFSYDTLTRKVTVYLQNDAELYFGDIGYVVGILLEEDISKSSTAEREVDLEHGFHDLYVYCDVYMLFTGREVRIGKNCARGLEYGPRPQAEGHTQDMGHSFSQYGPT